MHLNTGLAPNVALQCIGSSNAALAHLNAALFSNVATAALLRRPLILDKILKYCIGSWTLLEEQ